ncbi:MAG: 3-hydroxy-3-methylglutaryl-CoA reductase, partial [Nitrospiraceae bacterium]
CYTTGDAMGMNMITFATEEACKYIVAAVKPKKFYLQSNFSSMKKVSFHNFVVGYGKSVVSEVTIPRSLIKWIFHISPEEIVDYYQVVRLSTTHAGMIGISGHTANALAAVFIACGQDVASVVDSHVGVTNFEVTEEGDLYVSVKLPSLLVGTIGGGTDLATQRECLGLLGCSGPGQSKKFAEILAATALAGEIAICAKVANGTFPNAHKKYGRKTFSDSLSLEDTHSLRIP